MGDEGMLSGSVILWYTVDHRVRIEQLLEKAHIVNSESALLEWHAMLGYHLNKVSHPAIQPPIQPRCVRYTGQLDI